MTFRSIRPAPLPLPGSSSQQPPEQTPTKRPQVAQACYDCRRSKIKCDGVRPKCGTCVSRRRACGYSRASNHLSLADAKARLDSLERLVAALRNASQDQAQRLLQSMRADDEDDLAQAMEETAVSAELANPSTSPDKNSIAGETAQKRQTLGFSEISVASSPSRNSSFSSSNPSDPSSIPTLVSLSADRLGLETHATSGSSSSGQLPNPAIQAQELDGLALPDASITQEAVQSFFSCSGKLFHVFTQSQSLKLHNIVFDHRVAVTGNKRAAIGALMAVASVGAQYMPDQFGNGVAAAGFYKVAKNFFEDVIEHQPLNAIKTSILLAQYNIMDKATVSLAYIEIGLGMSRQYGLSNDIHCPANMPPADWVDLRLAWRTLIFFSSWLSSTLGYISGNDIFSGRVQLSEMLLPDPTDISDVVQAEMTKICLLKADVLRIQLTSDDFSVSSLSSTLQNLRNWYAETPPVMRLEASAQQDLPLETRRSILHIHLLYLGAMMLLYRRVVSQFVQSHVVGTHASFLEPPLRNMVLEFTSEVSLAATASARILKLLLEDNHVFKRCWLVIFQTYTTGTVLLHIAVQKQLHNFEPTMWQDEGKYGKICLSVLSFCGSIDRVANRFHAQLSELYDQIFTQHETTSSSETVSADMSFQPESSQTPWEQAQIGHNPLSEDHSFLLHIPPQADASRANISRTLMTMLSRPFGASVDGDATQAEVNMHHFNYPAKWEYPTAMEGFKGDLEVGNSFQWDFEKLNVPPFMEDVSLQDASVPPVDPALSSHAFLDSVEPSGWTQAMDMTMRPGSS